MSTPRAVDLRRLFCGINPSVSEAPPPHVYLHYKATKVKPNVKPELVYNMDSIIGVTYTAEAFRQGIYITLTY